MANPKKKKGKSAPGTPTSKERPESGAHKKGKKRKHGRSSPPPEEEAEEEWVPPPNSQVRYDDIEMNLIRMELAYNHSRVMTEAVSRWDLIPVAGPIPPPSPPKDPTRAQLAALAEHRRRLGRAAEGKGPRKSLAGAAAADASAEKKKETEMKEKEGLSIVGTIEGPEEEAAPGVGRDSKMDPCEMLEQPCRRFFTAPCRPCPEHTPGLPRDPSKVCTCTMSPRQETLKAALRFLSLMPRELRATFSSLDPVRIEQERQRKLAEGRWRRRLDEQRERFDKAVRGARALLESPSNFLQV